MWIKRSLITFVVLGALLAAYFWVALTWSYSSGERAGWVQKFSRKGWLCKTWEGELALVTMPGSTVEKFAFTVHDDATAQEIQQLMMGKRVTLHYEEKVGLPTSCFGDTRHFVTQVSVNPGLQIGPAMEMAPPSPAPSAAASAASAPR